MSLASGVTALATRIADEVNTLRGEITTALAGYVPTSRTISPGTGLTGGGDLSANRTLTVAYGTSSSTAAVGNDARLSDTRTPTDGTVTNAKVDAAAAIAESKLALASDAVAGTASRRTLGTGSTQAAAGNHAHAAADTTSGTFAIARIPTGTTSSTVAIGNDSRLSDTRTPTALSVTDASVSATAAIAETKLSLASDAVAGTASRRTLGTGATQAAAGNHAHAAADVTSGTLAIARIPTGTTSSTVCIGNDSRLSDTRTPSALSVTDATVSASAAIAESKLSLASDAVAATASRRTLGTGSTQAAAGNDARLSDTRTPTDGTVTDAKVATGAAIAETKLSLASDAAAGTASRRTLGTGATQAAAGNHTHTSSVVTSSGTGTVTLDASAGSTFAHSATGAVTFAPPTNPTDGQRLLVEVLSSAVTARVITPKSGTMTLMTGLSATLSATNTKAVLIGMYYSTRAGHWIVTAFNVEP